MLSGLKARPLFTVLQMFWCLQRRPLQAGVLLSAVTVLFGMALLGLSGWFISATAIAGLSVATALAFDVFMPSAGIRLFALGRTFSRYGERLITHDATLAAVAVLRVQLFRAWARPHVARALALRPSRLLFRLTCDIDALDSLYLRLCIPLQSALVASLAATLALALISPGLALATLMALALTALPTLSYLWIAGLRPACKRALLVERLRGQAADLLSGQTDLMMTGQLSDHCRTLGHIDRRLAREEDRLHQFDTRAGMTFGLLGSILLSGTLAVTGWLVTTGAIGVPVAVLAVLLALTLAEPLGALRRGAFELARTSLAARRLVPYLTENADITMTPQRSAPVPCDPFALKLQDIHVRHDGAKHDCLHGIHLRIASGERVALVGHSGAGKSSLMAVLTGELQPRLGQLRLIDHAWLTQRTELFNDTLRDNLLLAAPHAQDTALWEALRIAGLFETVARLPSGLETRLGDSGLGLSAGQARRLALARLLLRERALWLLDEPTEGLDKPTAEEVLARLAEQGAGRTWLLATHLRREAALADRLVVLEHGRIIREVRRGSSGFDAALDELRPD
ncbi:ATP-binding cassette domain-containing protein [Pseudomonas qingdaonensis]|uniref:ATP-binding cassette domain-containing protein n=1 Tax=Pseudomonas qingdaonensis TaxID=2056231 RepID=A0ABX8DVJ0_9PSED|nr:ATP-binding cassette domain-containing protein [Pseudomonas qingdaonensis]QVL20338.1 ATP-binding cassette domain-containing protein [Pseudomonas qingdaonensis]